jgi:inward rectifier potassium channel
MPGCVSNAQPGSLFDALFFSIETLATVGYGEMAPAGVYGHFVAALEIMSGMAFTAIMTGLIFVRFSRPRAKIVYADKAVISHHNGLPTLMIRIANGRLSALASTVVTLDALIPETTNEGRIYRRLHALPLTRSTIPMFGLIVTLFHQIDERSPLAGYDAESLLSDEVRLILGIEARDPHLAAVVHDVKNYTAADIAFGMHYVDAMNTDDNGQILVDLTKISLIEPVTANTADVELPVS